MTTQQKLIETLKRIVNAPLYFYRYYKSFRQKYDTREALIKAAERTGVFLSKIIDIWNNKL